MSLLVFRFPARERADDPAGPRGALAVSYALSEDGRMPTRHGSCAPALLPHATSVVGVMPADALSWHQIVLPKAPAQRLRAALVGVLEEALLEDPELVHLAVEPRARAGQQVWVCAMDRARLKSLIEAIEQHGVRIDRIVPELEPRANPEAIVLGPQEAEWPHDGEVVPEPADADTRQLLWADARGVLCLPLHSALVRELARGGEAAWSAEPAAAQAAEELLGHPVTVLDRASRLLDAAQSDWNLRQFEFVPRSRGTRALRDLGRALDSAEWRPARWGLLALLGAHLLGLNAWAWQHEAQVRARQSQIDGVVRNTFPHVQVVLDAPLQMRRELDLLRARAGQPGADDVEPLLGALASDWPADLPISALEYESGRLTVVADGLDEDRVSPLRDNLEASGYRIDLQGNRLVVAPPR